MRVGGKVKYDKRTVSNALAPHLRALTSGSCVIALSDFYVLIACYKG